MNNVCTRSSYSFSLYHNRGNAWLIPQIMQASFIKRLANLPCDKLDLSFGDIMSWISRMPSRMQIKISVCMCMHVYLWHLFMHACMATVHACIHLQLGYL